MRDKIRQDTMREIRHNERQDKMGDKTRQDKIDDKTSQDGGQDKTRWKTRQVNMGGKTR